eukprot:7136226-Karenia_brevis.AAC.1
MPGVQHKGASGMQSKSSALPRFKRKHPGVQPNSKKPQTEAIKLVPPLAQSNGRHVHDSNVHPHSRLC